MFNSSPATNPIKSNKEKFQSHHTILTLTETLIVSKSKDNFTRKIGRKKQREVTKPKRNSKLEAPQEASNRPKPLNEQENGRKENKYDHKLTLIQTC